MKDESLSFMWGNEVPCCVWSCPAVCFVEAGWVHVWVGLGAAGQLHGGLASQRRPLYLTRDAPTGTPCCFDPRVNWITWGSLQSCDYKSQSCTQEDMFQSLRTKRLQRSCLFEFPCSTISRFHHFILNELGLLQISNFGWHIQALQSLIEPQMPCFFLWRYQLIHN